MWDVSSWMVPPALALSLAHPLCLDQSEVDQLGASLKGRGNSKVASGFGESARSPKAQRGQQIGMAVRKSGAIE